ncbi:MAG: putative protein-disulfide isomerase [Gammaproteobacteria bacterium]|jgi:putative protein-disulfide isomerase
MNTRLIVVHDPMCSWCWGFAPVLARITSELDGKLPIEKYLGGLAPDSDQPMPENMMQSLEQTWQHIQHRIPGTEFNFSFWTDCKPRRSTYPACRAVIAARQQGHEFDDLMTRRLQEAYYTEAKNPSDISTHIELASELGLDADRFSNDLKSDFVNQTLIDEMNYSRSIGIDSFPSLAVEVDGQFTGIPLNYTDADEMLANINRAAGIG